MEREEAGIGNYCGDVGVWGNKGHYPERPKSRKPVFVLYKVEGKRA